MHRLIYLLSYLSLPFLFLIIYLLINSTSDINNPAHFFLINPSVYPLLYGLLPLTLLFIYARFIEPNIIKVQTTSINTGFPLRIIVIADIHLGAYKNTAFLQRVVHKINQLKNIDAVLIPGDFTYYPSQSLKQLFAPLKDIQVPVYGILGNHDCEKPGPALRTDLKKCLKDLNVIFLHNNSVTIEDSSVTLLGLGDNWANEDKIDLIEDFSNHDNLIVMTHNPDTVLNYNNSIANLTVTGHTHGGQIRIPLLYKKIIPCKGDFDQGLYKTTHGQVFVTSGLGEVGLPLRLGIPPVIDILELS